MVRGSLPPTEPSNTAAGWKPKSIADSLYECSICRCIGRWKGWGPEVGRMVYHPTRSSAGTLCTSFTATEDSVSIKERGSYTEFLWLTLLQSILEPCLT